VLFFVLVVECVVCHRVTGKPGIFLPETMKE
jgi:hypothetical protein